MVGRSTKLSSIWLLTRLVRVGYFWDETFLLNQVIVVEDDLEISPDFFEYFSATLPLLKQDKSLW